jgi:hypothetical protein
MKRQMAMATLVHGPDGAPRIKWYADDASADPTRAAGVLADPPRRLRRQMERDLRRIARAHGANPDGRRGDSR